MQFGLRFSLRTLLIITVLVAIPSAWLGKHWLRTRVQRPIVAKIKANGGEVWYDYQVDGQNFNSNNEPPGWAPLRAMLGDDFFAVVKVALYGHRPSKQKLDIEFDRLSELEQLHLNCDSVSEDSIVRLAKLKQLEMLSFSNVICRPETLRNLSDCPALKSLTMQGDNLSTEHARELQNFTKLTGFQWVNSPLEDEGLLAICELRNLESLDLLWSNSTPQLTARGYAGLAQLKNLQTLQLSGPADDGVAAIANLPELKSVLLWADQLTDARHVENGGTAEIGRFKNRLKSDY